MIHRELWMPKEEQIRIIVCFVALAFGSFSVALILKIGFDSENIPLGYDFEPFGDNLILCYHVFVIILLFYYMIVLE